MSGSSGNGMGATTRQNVTLSDIDGSRLGSQELTAADLAERFSLTPREVVRAAERGELPCTWWGTRPVFASADIEQWMEDQSYRPQSRVVVENIDPLQQPVPYQRADGRWSVRLICPDGRKRRFVSRGPREGYDEQYGSSRRAGLSMRTRYNVLTRDGHRCVYCGATPQDDRLQIDHKVPVSKGGSDDMENLVTACRTCNLGKADS